MDENKKAAQKKKISHFITMAVLVILFLAFIFPFIMVIFNAFKTKGDITADPLALVGSHGFILTNFTDAMKKMNFATSFTNSLLITTVSTILTIMLSAMTAFVIVRNKWKACGILFSLMIASMVIPFQVLMIPLVSLYGGIFGVLNSRITLILMHVGFSLSFFISCLLVCDESYLLPCRAFVKHVLGRVDGGKQVTSILIITVGGGVQPNRAYSTG